MTSMYYSNGFGQLMLNHQWDADPLTHISPYTNTILARQCITSSDKFLETFTQFIVPNPLSS